MPHRSYSVHLTVTDAERFERFRGKRAVAGARPSASALLAALVNRGLDVLEVEHADDGPTPNVRVTGRAA